MRVGVHEPGKERGVPEIAPFRFGKAAGEFLQRSRGDDAIPFHGKEGIPDRREDAVQEPARGVEDDGGRFHL
jgi:hypothetical protein